MASPSSQIQRPLIIPPLRSVFHNSYSHSCPMSSSWSQEIDFETGVCKKFSGEHTCEQYPCGRKKQILAEVALGYNLVSTKAPASRSSAITGCRLYLEREYDLGQRGFLHLRAMAREGLNQSPHLVAHPGSWGMAASVLMWDLGRVSYFYIR